MLVPQRYDGVLLISREGCEAIVHDAAHIIRMGNKALIPVEDYQEARRNIIIPNLPNWSSLPGAMFCQSILTYWSLLYLDCSCHMPSTCSSSCSPTPCCTHPLPRDTTCTPPCLPTELKHPTPGKICTKHSKVIKVIKLIRI